MKDVFSPLTQLLDAKEKDAKTYDASHSAPLDFEQKTDQKSCVPISKAIEILYQSVPSNADFQAMFDGDSFTNIINEKKDFLLTFTDDASNWYDEILRKMNLNEIVGLRVVPDSGGCKGYIYNLKFPESNLYKNDYVISDKGKLLFLNEKFVKIVEGGFIDLENTLTKQGLLFKKFKSISCGCGKSFL